MDEVRPGDLVGAITNEAGVSRSDLGRVDVRERHSTVEVSSSVANAVVSRLTGVQIRGRRVIARVDEDRPRERPRRSGSDRGERRSGPRSSPRSRSPRE
jgi:ATP-dependent RNA helicase DeaD